MKPKRWVDLSAIKRLLVMPSCVCWFSCEAAAAAQQHSLIPLASAAHPWTVEPHLFSAKALWCPHLLYLFLSACCIRLQEPCRQHPRGWEGSFPWEVHTLIKMPLAVGHGPAAPTFLVLKDETAPGTAPQEVVAWGQGEGPQVEGLCSVALV